jgi:hypothetical protein
VDSSIYAQPLFAPNVTIPGLGTFNVAYVATMKNTVYAFDADGKYSGPLWKTTLSDPVNGITSVPLGDYHVRILTPECGILGTPVIDPATNTLYAVTYTRTGNTRSNAYAFRVNALDTTTGAIKVPPVVASGTSPGTGLPHTGTNTIKFEPYWEWQRAALLLSNGVLYVGFGAQDENGRPAHGWLFAFDAASLQQLAFSNMTPDDSVGSFWGSGSGPGADAAGNVFGVTGNGTFDGIKNWGESVLRFNYVALQGLQVNDYFTPSDYASLSAGNSDLGSGGVLMLPDPPPTTSTIFPHLALAAGKKGEVYIMNRDDLGGLGNDLQIVQNFMVAKPVFASPAYWNERIYYLPNSSPLLYFTRGNDGFLSGPITTSTGQGGTNMSISANGNTGGVLWLITGGGSLTATDAMTMTQLYTSGITTGSRDSMGPASKWSLPTVSNGKVYVGGRTYFTIYGLLP